MAEMTMGDIKAIREGRGNPSKMGGFLSKVVGTIAGSLIIEGADPMIAMMMARNAVENNYFSLSKTWQHKTDEQRRKEAEDLEVLTQEVKRGYNYLSEEYSSLYDGLATFKREVQQRVGFD
jgi:hypothetical protein